MSEPGDITEAVHRWKDHDPGDGNDASDLEHVLRPFLMQLLALVRRRRPATMQARIDSEAVVNQALKSFLSGVPKGEFPILNNRDDVLKVLRTLVLRALIGEKRTHCRGKRSVFREQPHEAPLPEAVTTGEGLTTAAGQLLPGAKEFLEALLPVLRPVDPRAIDIVEMRLEGLSNNEIADQLGIGPRMVQVIRQKMKDAWEQAHRGDNTDAL
jgi:hypothetical protein